MPNNSKGHKKELRKAPVGAVSGAPSMPGKPVSASVSEIVEIVLPNDANLLGNMLGGRVMHLIDIAGALAANRKVSREDGRPPIAMARLARRTALGRPIADGGPEPLTRLGRISRS